MVEPHALRLLLRAMAVLLRWRLALVVTVWSGARGNWLLKLFPLLLPPFRAVILNRNGDFFAARPGPVARHNIRKIADWARSGGNRLRDLGAAGLFWSGGQIFRACRAVMRRSGGREFPFLRFPHGDERLSPECAAADERFLIWRPEGQPEEDVEDLLPLFADERTFAVGRQAHFRGWRASLFAMAPFRQLQPGEAARVLAPLGGTLVVDAAKLRRLEMPTCRFTLTAWMMVFWKAAACGWRSFAVGGTTPATEQPDFPVQESEFLWRTLRSRSLRRLGPRNAALSRGSIAFAPALARRPGGKPRPHVVLVSPFLPFPLSHGGAVRMYNLSRALSAKVDFTLVAVREQEEEVDYRKLHEVFREVYVVDKDSRAGRDERLPEQVRQHELPALRALVAELVRERRPDLLQVEYTHLAGLRTAAAGTPAILVEHDLTFQLYGQLAAASGNARRERREYERWLEFEREWLNRYDAVWTMSEEDRLQAITVGRRDPEFTFCVPNGVDIERFVPWEEPAGAPEILYVGSFRHLPNLIGFEKLRDCVMPAVWRAFPSARLRVVAGPRAEEFGARFGRTSGKPDPRVEIHGFVEDLRPLYARASVVVAPLAVSAGTNIKVLEALACGKALVTTAAGCAGLGLSDGRDARIASDWEGFAAATVELLADPARRANLGTRGRRTVEQRFSWNGIARSALETYEMLLADRSEAAERTASAGD